MIWKALILLGLALCVLGDLHATSEQKVLVRHKIAHDKHDDHGHHGHHEKYGMSYPSYEFEYKVDDPHTGDKKGHEEKRDGDEVKGMYWLMQPDGRKRIVKYYADKKSGFHADVEYIGHAKHDKDHKSHHIPHYPDVEHKSIIIDYDKKHDEGGYKVEDHDEDIKDFHHDDKHGYSSEEQPFIDLFQPMPYKRPLPSVAIEH